ncbi:ferrous iron transport protein A [Anaerospora hongkongensis]|uniref:Ferrous iron transport protein A n=1 Tax=Anaerospora hongkongensis TaxID=244830 RepID=A0A4R1Q718_9FIRM|nr:FeoA family protein [Anaerospora hongkongensis]TCL37180.1 ferrous iron transport protein A [Anaerospora hongkongensis]
MSKLNENAKLIPITNMQNGQEGTIVELVTQDKNILRKLMSMGILPGVGVKLIMKYPSVVLQAGYTQVALDLGIASVVVVDPIAYAG